MKPADLDPPCFPKRIKKLKNVLKTVVYTVHLLGLMVIMFKAT